MERRVLLAIFLSVNKKRISTVRQLRKERNLKGAKLITSVVCCLTVSFDNFFLVGEARERDRGGKGVMAYPNFTQVRKKSCHAKWLQRQHSKD